MAPIRERDTICSSSDDATETILDTSPKPSLESWWQRLRTLDPADITRLYESTLMLRSGLIDIGNRLAVIPTLNRDDLASLPTAQLHENVEVLLTTLRLAEPARELVQWHSDGAALVERIATRFEILLGELQRLYHLRPTTIAYSKCLSSLRNCVTEIDVSLAHLCDHFSAYFEWSDLSPVAASNKIRLFPRRMSENRSVRPDGLS